MGLVLLLLLSQLTVQKDGALKGSATGVNCQGPNVSCSVVNGKWMLTVADGGTPGSVTSVSVTSANGVSGVVATPTTTPAITLTLGNITPGSVAATGTVTGSNLSGTNTGDITLGPVGAAPNANGASLVGQLLNLQAASNTLPGAITALTQEFGGNKTFINRIKIGSTGAPASTIEGNESSIADVGVNLTNTGVGLQSRTLFNQTINDGYAAWVNYPNNYSGFGGGNFFRTSVMQTNLQGGYLFLTDVPAAGTQIGFRWYQGNAVEQMRLDYTTGNLSIGTGGIGSERLNVSGNGLFTGTLLASNLSGTNTGDQTKTCSAKQWVSTLASTTTSTCTQPNYTDIAGSVPAPTEANLDQSKFLRGDGTWTNVPEEMTEPRVNGPMFKPVIVTIQSLQPKCSPVRMFNCNR